MIHILYIYVLRHTLIYFFNLQVGYTSVVQPVRGHPPQRCAVLRAGLRQPPLQLREGRRDPLDSIRVPGKKNVLAVNCPFFLIFFYFL